MTTTLHVWPTGKPSCSYQYAGEPVDAIDQLIDQHYPGTYWLPTGSGTWGYLLGPDHQHVADVDVEH